MPLKPEDLATVATLAKLDIPANQTERLRQDIEQILTFVEQMNAQDTADIKPLGSPLERPQRLRADQVTETDQREALQSVTRHTEQGLYLVPKVIE